MDEVKLALEMSKLVHDECKDVPHDIGLRLLEIVKRNVNKQLSHPLVDGSLPCHHNFIQKDTYWKSCTHCGMLAPLGQ